MIDFCKLTKIQRAPLGARCFSPNDGLLDFASPVTKLVDSVLNFFGTKSTNKTNRQIADANNALQQELWQKEADFTTDMWNKTNEYNTPSAQRERFEEAGINPAFALGNMSSGSAIASSTPSHGALQTPTMQAPHFDFSSAVDSYMRQKQQEAQTRYTEAMADEQEANALYADAVAAEKYGILYEEREGKRLENRYNSDTFDARTNMAYAAAKRQETGVDIDKLTAERMQLENAYQRFMNSKVPESFAADMAIKRQTFENMILQGKYTIAQAKAAYAAAAVSAAQADNIRYDTKFKQQNEALFVGSLAADLLNKKQQYDINNAEFPYQLQNLLNQCTIEEKAIRQQGQDYWNVFRYAGNIFGPAGNIGAHAIK